MCRTVGLPMPSAVSYCLGLSVGLPGWIYVTYSLVSSPFSHVDLVFDSVFCCSWLDFLAGPWTSLIVSPCLGLSRRPITNPVLPKSYGTAPWLVRALPCLFCGQALFPAYQPSWNGPTFVVHHTVHQHLQFSFSVSSRPVLPWWLFHLW